MPAAQAKAGTAHLQDARPPGLQHLHPAAVAHPHLREAADPRGLAEHFQMRVLAGLLHINFSIAGHAVITEIIVAFVGAVILLFVLRLLGFGRGK